MIMETGTAKQKLIDRTVNSAKHDIRDALVPELLLRVRPTGTKSYALYTRFPGSTKPERRTIGKVGAISLAEAREKARKWLDLIARGIDPADELQRELHEIARKRKDTIAVVATIYVNTCVVGPNPDKPLMRNARKIKHAFDDILIPIFGKRPIAELTHTEVSLALREIEQHGTDQAMVNLEARHELRRPNRAGGPAPVQARFFSFSGQRPWDRILAPAACQQKTSLRATAQARARSKRVRDRSSMARERHAAHAVSTILSHADADGLATDRVSQSEMDRIRSRRKALDDPGVAHERAQ